jgi:hypothetical protein
MAKPKQSLVVCVRNEGYEASLEARKIYVAIDDSVAVREKLIRVVDESGEDYLYPQSMFRPLELEPKIRRAVLAAT